MNFQVKNVSKKYLLFIVLMCVWTSCLVCLYQEAFAQSGSEEDSPGVTGITAGRTRAIVVALIGLISIITGCRARLYSNSFRQDAPKKGNYRIQAIIALLLGGIAISLSVMHLYTSADAVFGSGSGKAGAIVALIFSVIGATLGGLALWHRKSKSRA